jgi:hypothetical protein
LKAQVSIAAAVLAATGAVCGAATATSPDSSPTALAAQKGEPLVEQMVVPRGGKATLKKVRAKRGTVKLKGKRCLVPAATPLAALLRTSWRDKLRLRDYGSCSMKAIDSSGLFVKAMGPDVNSGLDGWVYKVGRKLGTAGAADPAGPFGDGRLRSGKRVVWFYCVFNEASCQRSLEIRRDGTAVTVTGYDDAGDGVPIAGARVTVRPSSGATVARTTGADGRVDLPLAAGSYVVRATKSGLIPAFPERIQIP